MSTYGEAQIKDLYRKDAFLAFSLKSTTINRDMTKYLKLNTLVKKRNAKE